MSRTSMFFSLLATFTAGLLLAACDPMSTLAPLPAAPDSLAAPEGPGGTSYACSMLQSAEVCNATQTCAWSTNTNECVRVPYKAIKY